MSVAVFVRTLDIEKLFVTFVSTIQGRNSSAVHMIVTANCGTLKLVCIRNLPYDDQIDYL